MSENPDNSYCDEAHPDELIVLNGERYILERKFASWGVIEVMVLNPAVSEYVSDLESRLEKAEAERDGTCGDEATCNYVLAEWNAAVATARNDALEEAASAVRGYVQRDPETGDEIADFILSLKSSPPTPNQGWGR